MSRRSVMRYIKLLINSGLVVNLSQDNKDGVPLVLRVTNCHRLPVTESHRGCDNLSLKDSLYLPPDVEGGGVDTITPFQALYAEFVNLTQLVDFGNNPKWIKAISEMAEAEITVEDLRKAVATLNEKEYTITGPWSVKRAASVAKSERLRPVQKAKTQTPSEVY